ncbi:MAG: MFS transporter, partial [Gemmatimonadota bacterium]|nr:MFS transporter [Gemmatimonadota bacterium]
LIGSVKLKLAEVLSIDDAKVGGLISTLMSTSIIVILAIGPLVDAWGHKPIAITGFALTGGSIFLIALARTYKQAVLACMFLGLGAMCINTVGNTLMPIVLFGGKNAPAALNLGNAFFGVGAFITPLIVGLLIRKLSFTKTISIIALFTLLPIIFALAATNFPELPPGGFKLSEAVGMLGKPIVLVAALALFCYVALEASMGGWITTYLTDVGYSPGGANGVLSGFWIAIMAARLGSVGLVTPEKGAIFILVLAVASVVTLALMVGAENKRLAAIAVVLTGLAFGPIFPTIVGVTFSKVEPAVHGSVFAIIFAVGLLGASTIPAAIGIYSKGKTIRKSLVIAVVTAVVLSVLGYLMGCVG